MFSETGGRSSVKNLRSTPVPDYHRATVARVRSNSTAADVWGAPVPHLRTRATGHPAHGGLIGRAVDVDRTHRRAFSRLAVDKIANVELSWTPLGGMACVCQAQQRRKR